MKVESLAKMVISACEGERVDYMITGAFAVSYYGIPRSTKDVDFVIALQPPGSFSKVIGRLEPDIGFDSQVQFDTLTWGRRHIGRPVGDTALKVELFELFDDPFVVEQFGRRKKFHSPQLDCDTWLPTAEDVVVQKLRWGRPKDLEDAKDVLAVQGAETLDMEYIRKWCASHGTLERLENALEEIPPM